MMKGGRLLNFRPFLAIFALLAAAILFSLIASYVFPLGVALLALLATVMAGLTALAAVRRDPFRIAVWLTAFALCAIAVFAYFHTLSSRYVLAENEEYLLTGRVTEHYSLSDGVYTATLDELTADGEALDGRLSLTVENLTDPDFLPDCGDVIKWSSRISLNELVGENGVNASSVRSDVRYYAYAENSDIRYTAEGSPYALETLRSAIRDKLIGGMGEQAGAVAFGMIAGDRYLISDEVTDAFAGAGIGHILAVSGLHIGFVAMLCAALLGRLRMPPALRAAIITAALLLYVLFTGGSPSAVRAFVMCAVTLWARYFGLRDGLNTLCAAGTVCLLMSPFYLFECGFLMSMGSVYGLIAFSRPINSLLSKTGMPRFLSNGLAASLAVQIAIIPLTAVFFSEIYLYSIIVNAIMMPILGAAYIGMLVILPFTFIPPLAPLILLPSAVIKAIMAASAAVSALPFAAVTVRYSVGAVTVLPVSFIVSRFLLRPRLKIKAVAFAAFVLAAVFVFGNAVRTDNGIAIIGGGAAATVLLHGDTAYLIADFTQGSRVSNAISRSRLLCGSFVIYEQELTDTAAKGIIEFSENYGVDCVVFPLTEDTSGYKRLADAGIKTIAADETAAFDVAYSDGRPCGWLFKNDSITAYITSGLAARPIAENADFTRAKMLGEECSARVYTAWDTGAGSVTVKSGKHVLIDLSVPFTA